MARHAEPFKPSAPNAFPMEKATAPRKERLSPAEDFDEGIVRHAEPVETEARLAVAMENATAPAKELEPESTPATGDRKSTRLNSSHGYISYAVFCLKKKKTDCPYHLTTPATS